MFTAFNAFRLAGSTFKPAPVPQDSMLFEVQLVDATDLRPHRIGGIPLTVFTNQPLEVAGELLRDRDPNQWDVRIRALAHGDRPV